MSDRDDLARFIDELRALHVSGEFRGQADGRILPEITLGDVDRAIGHMLGTVDEYRARFPENRRHFAGPRQMLALPAAWV